MPEEKSWTVEEIILWTWKYFERKGISEARLKSELLLAEIMNTDRTHIYVNWKNTVEKKTSEKYRELIQRCISGEPFEYVIGYKEFMTFRFEVSPDVLIPRQETEELVEWVVKENRGKQTAFLDVGTGSGVVGISVAKLLKNSRGFLTDISQKALAVAKRNAEINKVQDRLSFFEGDLLEPVENILEEIDLIISNPPYIAYKDSELVAESVKNYEPETAIFSGEDGFEIFKRFAGNRHRLKGKPIYFEIGYNQKTKLEEIFSEAAHKEFRKDIYGNWRKLKIVF